MRVFILYANPVATSFGAALHKQVVATLQSRGYEIDDCDLYLELFDPIMSTEERIAYHDTATSRTGLYMPIGCLRPRRLSLSVRFGTKDSRRF